jgi:hypothetical protein
MKQSIGRVAAALLGATLALDAGAAIIYRWIDELGRSHVSDTVPARYRAKATRIDTSEFEIPPERSAGAQREVERLKSELDERTRPGDAKPQPRQSVRAASAPSASIRGRFDSASAAGDCDTLRQLFRESQECFAPYFNANGSVKAEAFARCVELPDPTSRCGIQTAPR